MELLLPEQKCYLLHCQGIDPKIFSWKEMNVYVTKSNFLTLLSGLKGEMDDEYCYSFLLIAWKRAATINVAPTCMYYICT